MITCTALLKDRVSCRIMTYAWDEVLSNAGRCVSVSARKISPWLGVGLGCCLRTVDK